jgi:hypothetical protein
MNWDRRLFGNSWSMARRGKKVLYVLAPVLRPEGPAPKGQDNLAQGLPWVSQQNVLCPEGARGIEMCMRFGWEPILGLPNGPFRAYRGGGSSPRVNPGLSFLAPSGRVFGRHD